MRIRVTKFWKDNMAMCITAGFAILCLLLWALSPGGHDLADLWLNLLAGFVASICTMLTIDRVAKKQKELEEKPLRMALYRDVQLFTSTVINLWQEMYIQSIEERSDIPIEELFSTKVLDEIFISLDLSGHPNVEPQQDWFSHIEIVRRNLSHMGETILARYGAMQEPKLFYAIHNLLLDNALLGRLRLIQQIHLYVQVDPTACVPALAYYTLRPTEQDCQVIQDLFQWCRTMYQKLEWQAGIYPIPEKVVSLPPGNPPASVLPKEVRARLKAQGWADTEIQAPEGKPT